MLTERVISGSIRLPAVATGGNPVSPVTVRVGLQPLFNMVLRILSVSFWSPATFFTSQN